MQTVTQNISAVTIPDTATLSGFQCFDIADQLDTEASKEVIDGLYLTGATKVVHQHIKNGVSDTDATATAIRNDLDVRTPVADSPDGSDMQKHYKKITQALRQAGKDAFKVPATETESEYRNGELKIAFKPIGSKAKNAETPRSRGCTVELVTVTQQKHNAAMAELKADQKKVADELKESQAADMLSETPVGEMLADVIAYVEKKYTLNKQRALVAAWLDTLDNTVIDDVRDSDSDSDSGTLTYVEALQTAIGT